MKKINYLIAAAAVASMSLFSCTGNADNASAKASGSETASTEQAAEGEQPAEEVKIEDQKELTCDDYTVTVPEGWKASSKMVRSSCNLTLKENPHSTAVLGYTLQNEADVIENLGKRECKAADDITVGDKTYKVYVKEGDRPEVNAFVPKGEGFVTFRIMPGGTPMKGDELKDVLMKNLNDIINATALK